LGLVRVLRVLDLEITESGHFFVLCTCSIGLIWDGAGLRLAASEHFLSAGFSVKQSMVRIFDAIVRRLRVLNGVYVGCNSRFMHCRHLVHKLVCLVRPGVTHRFPSALPVYLSPIKHLLLFHSHVFRAFCVPSGMSLPSRSLASPSRLANHSTPRSAGPQLLHDHPAFPRLVIPTVRRR
jgi:hypothetical protein